MRELAVASGAHRTMTMPVAAAASVAEEEAGKASSSSASTYTQPIGPTHMNQNCCSTKRSQMVQPTHVSDDPMTTATDRLTNMDYLTNPEPHYTTIVVSRTVLQSFSLTELQSVNPLIYLLLELHGSMIPWRFTEIVLLYIDCSPNICYQPKPITTQKPLLDI